MKNPASCRFLAAVSSSATTPRRRRAPVLSKKTGDAKASPAVVAEGSLLVVAANVVQAPNDKQQLEPMLAKINALPENLGKADVMLGDNGTFSATNVTACVA